MFYILQRENFLRVRRLLRIMLPIIVTQLAIIGMNFFDASMSGQAGAADLAGAAIGGNIWMPVHTGINGILMAAMPLIAHLLGEGRRQELKNTVRHGLLLAALLALLVIGTGLLVLPPLLDSMGLEAKVRHVAAWYLAGLGLGVLPFFLVTPLRCLVDTMGHTRLSMKIYLTALPINGCLNYVLIFGKCGLPRLGGIGAGLATGLTFWLLFAMFALAVGILDSFHNTRALGLVRPSWGKLREYLRIGLPMGFAIFMEAAIFGVVALFMAKFGTEAIAAHQAALSFCSLIYMIPLSFSLALTIVTGVEAGARRWDGARAYARIGVELSLLVAFCYMTLEYFYRDGIAAIYLSSPQALLLTQKFLFYGILWQLFDAIAAPIQGILRGYKDVDATFWSGMMSYWGICLPLGLVLDYLCGHGPLAYWQSLDAGVAFSAVFLSGRLLWLQKKKNAGREE